VKSQNTSNVKGENFALTWCHEPTPFVRVGLPLNKKKLRTSIGLKRDLGEKGLCKASEEGGGTKKRKNVTPEENLKGAFRLGKRRKNANLSSLERQSKTTCTKKGLIGMMWKYPRAKIMRMRAICRETRCYCVDRVAMSGRSKWKIHGTFA